MRPKFGAIPTDWIKSRGQMDQRAGGRRGGLFVSGGFLFLPAVNRVYGNRRTTQVLSLFPGSGLDGGRNLILTKLPGRGTGPAGVHLGSSCGPESEKLLLRDPGRVSNPLVLPASSP